MDGDAKPRKTDDFPRQTGPKLDSRFSGNLDSKLGKRRGIVPVAGVLFHLADGCLKQARIEGIDVTTRYRIRAVARAFGFRVPGRCVRPERFHIIFAGPSLRARGRSPVPARAPRDHPGRIPHHPDGQHPPGVGGALQSEIVRVGQRPPPARDPGEVGHQVRKGQRRRRLHGDRAAHRPDRHRRFEPEFFRRSVHRPPRLRAGRASAHHRLRRERGRLRNHRGRNGGRPVRPALQAGGRRQQHQLRDPHGLPRRSRDSGLPGRQSRRLQLDGLLHDHHRTPLNRPVGHRGGEAVRPQRRQLHGGVQGGPHVRKRRRGALPDHERSHDRQPEHRAELPQSRPRLQPDRGRARPQPRGFRNGLAALRGVVVPEQRAHSRQRRRRLPHSLGRVGVKALQRARRNVVLPWRPRLRRQQHHRDGEWPADVPQHALRAQYAAGELQLRYVLDDPDDCGNGVRGRQRRREHRRWDRPPECTRPSLCGYQRQRPGGRGGHLARSNNHRRGGCVLVRGRDPRVRQPLSRHGGFQIVDPERRVQPRLHAERRLGRANLR